MKVLAPIGEETFDAPRRRKKHKPEEIVAKLRDADAMPNTLRTLRVP